MIIYIIITIILLTIIYYNKFLNKLYLSYKLPGPFALPFIGNAWMLINKKPVENFPIFGILIEKYGDILRFWIGPDLTLIVTNTKYVETIMNNSKYIEKSDEYRFIKPWLNDGLLLSNGHKWSQRRKIITPAFHFKILENFIDGFEQQGDILIKKLKSFDKNDHIDLYPLITLYALDVICETAMGVSINAQLNSESNYVKAVQQIAHNLQSRIYHFLLRNDFFYKRSQLGKSNEKALKILHSFTENVIMERRQELEEKKKKENENKANNNNIIIDNNNNNNENDNDLGIKKKIAFLDILLESLDSDGKSLSNIDIREEVDTFMFEGHDTTTSGITFCLFNLAKYPDVQQKCYMEIEQVIITGDQTNRSLTLKDLNNLNYMDLVIRETMRLYPSVPLIGRKLRTPLKLGEYLIPADVNIIIPIYNIGRDPNIFKDPTEFRPERFDVEISADKFNPYGYIPFSAGPRNCIGQKFAMYEMKSIITKILKHFIIKLAPETEIEPVLTAELILRPYNSLKFIVTPRI